MYNLQFEIYTYIVVKRFCFGWMITLFSSFWCRTIKIPEHTERKENRWDKRINWFLNVEQMQIENRNESKNKNWTWIIRTTTRNVEIQAVRLVWCFSPIGFPREMSVRLFVLQHAADIRTHKGPIWWRQKWYETINQMLIIEWTKRTIINFYSHLVLMHWTKWINPFAYQSGCKFLLQTVSDDEIMCIILHGERQESAKVTPNHFVAVHPNILMSPYTQLYEFGIILPGRFQFLQ